MSLKTFTFALAGCLALASAASAATVTMTSSPGQVRTQTTGAGTYDVYDFFWTNEDGAEFTNYTVTGVATSGNFADPTRVQDDRQINPAAAGQDGATAGPVDMWANTVWSSAGKIDLGLTATILPDPAGYAPAGAGAAAPFTNFKWDVFDNVLGDDNDLNNDGDFPTAATAPYHIMRVVTSEGASGTIDFLAYDTSQPGIAFPFPFAFGIVQNTPPSVDPEPADLDPPLETGGATPGPGETNLVSTVFTGTDLEDTPAELTFSNAVLSNFVPLYPGSTNPLFNGSVAADGTFTWNTTGFARGLYTIDVTVTDTGGLSSSGGNYLVSIDAVPEPSTLTLFGLAIVGLVGLRRRNG